MRSTLPLSPSTQPRGAITFRFTDIEGSAQLWEPHPQAIGRRWPAIGAQTTIYSVVEVDVSRVGAHRPCSRVRHRSDLGEHAVEVAEIAGSADDDLGGLVDEAPCG
jgi:hypothetical protein